MRAIGFLTWLVLAVIAAFALIVKAEGVRELAASDAKDCPAGQAMLELSIGREKYQLGCYAPEQLLREQVGAKLGGQPVVLRYLVIRTCQ